MLILDFNENPPVLIIQKCNVMSMTEKSALLTWASSLTINYSDYTLKSYLNRQTNFK